MPTGAGLSHGGDTILTDTTWRASDSPHRVTFGFIVEKGATLTLQPCAEVRIEGGYGITVRGRLVANGTASAPIFIGAADATRPWSYVQLAGGTASLAYVTLENGGDPQDPNGLAALEARGDVNGSRQEVLAVDHVAVTGSRQFGVSLRDGATFTRDSHDLLVSGAALGPVRTSPRLAGGIPPGTYTGNLIDEVVVATDSELTEDTTFHDRGVPYRVGGTLRVGSGLDGANRATLTLEAGVTLRFPLAGSLLMSKNTTGTTGVLVAEGTATRPIVFTSSAAAPAAGDWAGLRYDGPDASNRLDFARVEYAGGPSQANGAQCEPTGGFSRSEDAAILLFGRPAFPFVTHTEIRFSAGDGIGRAWSDAPLDLSATNTFSQIAECNQGYPRDTNGACPASVPCEK